MERSDLRSIFVFISARLSWKMSWEADEFLSLEVT